MEIRKLLPDSWTSAQKAQELASLSAEYLEKSRKEVGEDVRKFKAKSGLNKTIENYDHVIPKEK